VIESEGNVLAIVLLQKPPGLWKTLAAETIALATGRSLLVASVADIGMTASKAEAKLRIVSDNAARWKSVFPLDEANVLLDELSSISAKHSFPCFSAASSVTNAASP
jgi:hypothetical protein